MRCEQPYDLLGRVDVQPLQRKLAGTPPHFWTLRTFRQDSTDTQRDTESIILCWSGFASAKREEFRHDAFQVNQWTSECQFFQPEIQPIHDFILSKRPGGILRSLLARLKPGGSIGTHQDIDPTFERSHRIHVPIVTERSHFVVDRCGYVPEEGLVFEFDNLRDHSVLSNDTMARIHLVVDVLPNERG